MPKIVNRAEMQGKILGAAMGCFFKQGVHATKMTDVARAAGIAKGTVYLYFKSKEELLAALLDKHFDEVRAQLNALPRPGTVADLSAGLTAALQAEDAGSSALIFEALGPGFVDPRARQSITGFFDWLGNYYADCLVQIGPQGGLRADLDPQAAGAALTAMLDGLVIHLTLTQATAETAHARAAAAVAILERGLMAQPETE